MKLTPETAAIRVLAQRRDDDAQLSGSWPLGELLDKLTAMLPLDNVLVHESHPDGSGLLRPLGRLSVVIIPHEGGATSTFSPESPQEPSGDDITENPTQGTPELNKPSESLTGAHEEQLEAIISENGESSSIWKKFTGL